MRGICRFVFWVFGWKIAPYPEQHKKAVLAHAPHTSNWDFLIGFAAFKIYRMPVKILIKKEVFFFPLGILIRAMGGIPVDRKKSGNLVEFAADLIKENDEMVILFTPEGTRKYSENWKTGFYRVAELADVPILIGYIDYKKKIGGFGPPFEKTGDMETDIETMKKFFRTVTAKYPEHGVK